MQDNFPLHIDAAYLATDVSFIPVIGQKSAQEFNIRLFIFSANVPLWYATGKIV